MANEVGSENRLVQAILNADIPDKVKARVHDWVTRATLNGQFVGLDKLAGEIQRQAQTRADYVVDSRNLNLTRQVNDAGVQDPEQVFLAFPSGPMTLRFQPSENCHKQLSKKCDIPQVYYDRMLGQNRDLLCDNVNAWLPTKDRRLVRTLDGKARALLSDKFRPLDNDALFFAAFKLFKANGCEIVRADLSENWFRMAAVSPDIRATIPKEYVTPTGEHKQNPHPGDILGGVSISNSETGHGALKVEGFTLRMWCLNGAVGEDVFARSHLGERLALGEYREETITQSTKAIWMQAQDQIQNLLTEVHVRTVADKMQGAMGVEIPVAATELVKGGWSGFDVTEAEKGDIMTHLLQDGEGLNQFGFSQAITATARDHTEGDRRAEMERLGYRYLSMPQEKFVEQITVMARPSTRRVVA